MIKKLLTLCLSAVLLLTAWTMNPVTVHAAVEPEWVSTSTDKGAVTETIIEGKRYWKLESTTKHDNGNNPGLFEPINGWNFDSKDVNLTFEFIPVSTSAGTRFSINLFHTDPSNAIFVGYDTGGWFWEYKVKGSGEWQGGGRVPAPEVGTKNTLRISLKDNKLLAWNSTDGGAEVLLFDKMIDANIVDTLYEKSQKGALKLGTYGTQLSSIIVLANNQDEIEIPDPGFERPVLDYYEHFEEFFDFETMNDAELSDLFNHISGNVKESIVDFNGSRAMRLDFNSSSGRQIVTFKKTPLLENMEIEADITLDGAMKRFGPTFRLKDGNSFAYIAMGDAMDQYFTEHFGTNNSYSSTTTSTEIVPKTTFKWKARIENQTLSLFIDDKEILSNKMGNVQTELGEFGFIKDRGTGVVFIDNLKISKITPERPQDPNNEGVVFNTLVTPEMEVLIDEGFPRVHSYTLSNGKVMDGQLTKINTIKINGKNLVPKVTFEKLSNTQANYKMEVSDGLDIDATLNATLFVKDNTLTFKINAVINNNKDQSTNDKIIRTIEIPNHSLVSVRSSDKEANLMGALSSTNTTISGDRFVPVTDTLRLFSAEYLYAFVSNEDVSAGIYSNSQHSGSTDFTRVTATAKEFSGFNSLGLSSSPWIYHRDVMFDPATTTELPEARVAITSDRNDDNVVNWQDGAIAFRDIMYSPIGAEQVKDLVAYRIAMNFGSHAQNPFLMTLDGIKKVNLHTDGLGQSILLKGYGSEGHDSGHLNYADIGKRIGGVEEMQHLLNEAVKYGASIGIHVNASETYPESKYFDEDRLMKDGNGNYSYGWNWIDQGININAYYDLANGRRERFEDLRNLFTEENLGWIYVDVWGNGQSGDNKAWTSHQLAKEIHDQGWRLGGEWGYAFEPDSTFQHWAADLTYGGYTLKGFNSSVMRFIFNHQRDAWVANYPNYSGAADNPLLGGYNMKDFEGWQGRNDYNGYMINLFENNLSTKFLQHFTVNRWVDGTPITMTNPDGRYFTWVPEMLVELVNEVGDKVVVERGSNDYANELSKYRSRTMTLNGRKILENDTYLIPWNWDELGKDLPKADEKLYHFNKKGGTTTWQLPSDWNNSTVVFYELTETGNKLIEKVSVNNGSVTLKAEANKAYVVYKGEKASVVPTYGEGAHIVDPGFNTQNLNAWDIQGDGAIVTKSQASNDMLTIKDNTEETRVSQVLTDLVPGEHYVAYVGVDNRSDLKASIELDVNGTLISNYTYKSIAKNYIKAYAHNTNSSTINGNSYFQNMFVYFTAPESGSVKLSLVREAGSGATFFDDIRVTKNNGNPYKDENTFFQDFEDNAQGIYPFVIGNIENVEDNRTHLSELNAPYTQRGWNNKKISDVIDGSWSVKTNGLTRRNKLVYQTIPQNVRFEADKEYKVSFSYEAGSEGTYAVIIGDGEFNGGEAMIPLSATLHKDGPQVFETTITGSKSGQTWIGIYSTDTAPNEEGTSGGTANFRSYKDIVLDNVKVQKVADITINDEVSNFTASGSNQVIDLEDVFTATPNQNAKDIIEQENDELNVKAYDLDIKRNNTSIILGEGQELIITAPSNSRIKRSLLARTANTVKGVFKLESDNSLTPIDFTQEDGVVTFTISELGTYVLNYEKELPPVVDNDDLNTLINSTKGMNEEDYTSESWNVLQDALARANEINANPQSTQDEVDIAKLNLQDAINALEDKKAPELDLSKLEEAIENYKDVDLELYTEETANIFEKAYKNAVDLLAAIKVTGKSVLFDEDSILPVANRASFTQEDIDKAVENLDAAFKGLKLKDDKPIDPTDPEVPVEPTDPTLPGTGLESNNIVLIGAGLLILVGIGLVVLRKKED